MPAKQTILLFFLISEGEHKKESRRPVSQTIQTLNQTMSGPGVGDPQTAQRNTVNKAFFSFDFEEMTKHTSRLGAIFHQL